MTGVAQNIVVYIILAMAPINPLNLFRMGVGTFILILTHFRTMKMGYYDRPWTGKPQIRQTLDRQSQDKTSVKHNKH